jgi:hypothetical protein
MSTKCIRRPHARWTTCHCSDCVVVMRRIAKRHRTGRLERVPSSAAWEQLEEWLEAGFEPAWIESACGIPRQSIQSAIFEARHGQGQRNFGARYSALIVNADIWSATGGRASAIGSRRRLRALQCMGWTNEALSRETGISFVTLASIQRGSVSKVSARLFHPIKDAYDRLAEIDGGSNHAKIRARKNSYLPPAAWDDPDTDPDQDAVDGRRDPDDIDHAIVTRVMNGERMKCTRAEREEVIERWRATGRTMLELTELTGWQIYRTTAGAA